MGWEWEGWVVWAEADMEEEVVEEVATVDVVDQEEWAWAWVEEGGDDVKCLAFRDDSSCSRFLRCMSQRIE